MSKQNVENFSGEIIDLIIETNKNDTNFIIDSLRYLFYTTNDDLMKLKIVDVFNEKNWCLECGAQMVYEEYNEIHDKLDDRPKETMGHYICLYCDKC